MQKSILPSTFRFALRQSQIAREDRLQFPREAVWDKTTQEIEATAVAESIGSYQPNFSCGISFHMSIRDSFNARSIAKPALVTRNIRLRLPPRALVAPPIADLT